MIDMLQARGADSAFLHILRTAMGTAIIMNPRVRQATGHVPTFTDPMIDSKNCKHRFRADHIEGDICPDCGAKGQFTEARPFNLIFSTHVGPVEESANLGYL